MGLGRFVHFTGSALLFISMILCIVVSVSAPVVKYLSFVHFELDGKADVKFGSFGYCVTDSNGDDRCSSTHIGYDAAKIMEGIDDSSFSMARGDSIKALTHVFVLHPVSAALLLISFLLSLFAGSFCGSVIAMFVSALTFVVSVVAVAVDFAVFALVLSEVRNGNGKGRYGSVIWMALAAAILTLAATLILAVTCCVGKRRRAQAKCYKLEAQTHPHPQQH
ncbi:SUR7/PalI family [Geosmithia morbida]|uniref:SUR7/PalI family n=1 Tax=Geosmithia morbida TaxID=1094350 RepID=A0A9P5D6L3_9HYPO|nr:SUR7/PalI family [Geosmithia morbida]KAF4125716.1 SUR7/PalI family [Geosmithia morbida]